DQYEGSIYVYYDEKGRPYSVSYPDTSYSYDYLANGLLSSIYGNNNTIGLSYDTWNNLVQVRNNVENWLYTTNYYAYDAEGNLTNKVLTFTDYYDTYTLIASTYLYDDNERLIGENDANGNPLWRYAYNAYSGKLAYATNMVSGIYCIYTYDALGRIQRMMYNKSTRGWIPYYIYYSYDSSGRVSSKDCYGGGQGAVGYTAYTYDDLGRIASETGYGVATNFYGYDLAGNRTSMYNTSLYGGITTSYSTSTNNNRLASWGSNGSMLYNDAGCVTYLTRNTKTNINSLSLSWNGEYQLTEVAVDSTANYNYIYYTYDSLGRKLSRMDNDTWEYYIYDGMNLVADYDAYNYRITRTYTYGPGVDNIQSMTIYDEYGGSETYYYVKDASNTVHVLVDEDGLIVEYYYYDAFGNLMKMRDVNYNLITESVYGNRFLFQGREYDYDTALYYFRARWYEPETGRWLSPDPIGISGGLNLYAFCENDPVNFIDPTGNGGIQFGDWFLGWGDPWLVFDASTIDEIGKGSAATLDGLIPWFDPFKDVYTNECGELEDNIYKWSYYCGQIADMSLEGYLGSANKVVGKVLFANETLMKLKSGYDKAVKSNPK
ncbi:MAG: RHS repeat-associated core domain-containing protein, partial [Verrucomicrobia bacterium]|nr:RHS repeat-associated core domain-containing protein [Verrucomicrobiota bacterium]